MSNIADYLIISQLMNTPINKTGARDLTAEEFMKVIEFGKGLAAKPPEAPKPTHHHHMINMSVWTLALWLALSTIVIGPISYMVLVKIWTLPLAHP